MPHNDDSFWVSVFRKSPLVATPMAICGLIGLGIGWQIFGHPQIPVRFMLLMLLVFACAGIFVGLIIGVALDSLVGALRDKDKKKRKHKR